jgi:CRP-like cAMP-binding protein
VAAFPSVHSAPLIRKLEAIFSLNDEERQALEAPPMQVQTIRAEEDLVWEGDRPSRSRVLLEGYASSYKMTGEGKRQIQSWHIPGDIPDLQSLHLKVLDISISTVTLARVVFIQREVLRDLCRRHPRLNDALWRETLIDAAIFREWMTNVGRREAYNRMAHLLCEWVVRLRAVGLVEDRWDRICDLPMTQSKLADATGLTPVHVNRVLQELRRDRFIARKGNKLTVLGWDQLKQVGDFDPIYLHLEPRPAAPWSAVRPVPNPIARARRLKSGA